MLSSLITSFYFKVISDQQKIIFFSVFLITSHLNPNFQQIIFISEKKGK